MRSENWPKVVFSTTLAVLRLTRGRVCKASRSFGYLAPVFVQQNVAGFNRVFSPGVKHTNGLDAARESIDAQISDGFCAVGGSEQRPSGFISTKASGLGG